MSIQNELLRVRGSYLVSGKALPRKDTGTFNRNPKMKKTKSITLYGRRWFQKTYGNTYHTVSIYVNGENVHNTEPEYGYGDQWEYTASEWLYENGYTPGVEDGPHGGLTPCLWRYCEENGIEYVRGVCDVSRERDL